MLTVKTVLSNVKSKFFSEIPIFSLIRHQILASFVSNLARVGLVILYQTEAVKF